MELPWNSKEKIKRLEDKIEELKQEIEELEEEKESYRKRFEAEKDRRSELSRKKQEAEKKLKELEQKQGGETEEEDEKHSVEASGEGIPLQRTKKILSKLDSYSSPEEDFITVRSPGSLEDVSDLKGLKNSVSREEYEFLSGRGFVAFIEPDLVRVKLKSRSYFSGSWEVSDSFEVSELQEFISEEKQWAAVSAGETRIVVERDGEIVEKEEISSRVEKQQKKGGFSQGRFERKRDEQIEEHVKQVEEKISEDTLLVGEERLCKKLSGKYLGGFDSRKNLVDALYGFQLERMEEV
jgi:hypothetical protein